MLGLAGLPLGLSLSLPRPVARRVRAGGRRARRGGLRRPRRRSSGSRDGAGGGDVRVRERPGRGRARRRRRARPARRSSRGRTGCARRSSSAALGIPTARFGTLEETGLPALVKSRRLGYDGKGQRRVDARRARSTEGELAEELVPFDRELSIVGVRGRDGDTRFWPRRRERPPRRDPARDAGARRRRPAGARPRRSARRCMDALDYVGVLAVELFEVGGRLLANEFAPRVHNTAHWTIDGAETSQFENHLRAILGLPLGSTGRAGSVRDGQPDRRRAAASSELLALPRAHVHLYGKEPREGRKVGHVTLVDPDEETVERAVALARRGARRLPPLAGVGRPLARGGARAGARGSTPRAGAGPRRACSARSSRRRRGRASPGRSAGRRRPRAGASRTSAAAGAGARVRARGPARSASRRRMRNAPGARERAAARVEEEVGAVPTVEVRPAERQVAAERLGGGPAERDEPLLAALARGRARCAPRGRRTP